ncbi:hypothetical protein AB0C44_07950 [Micromonospora taraxaci]|uniref:hypothetical protein n=1 Tax=Micromonospora taraxaci TaxID=1316803 RepID=UPI0033E48145
MRQLYIAVAAHHHPELDDWVIEQARAEAARSGAILGDYLGREDALGVPLPPEYCCHIFGAVAGAAPTTTAQEA